MTVFRTMGHLQHNLKWLECHLNQTIFVSGAAQAKNIVALSICDFRLLEFELDRHKYNKSSKNSCAFFIKLWVKNEEMAMFQNLCARFASPDKSIVSKKAHKLHSSPHCYAWISENIVNYTYTISLKKDRRTCLSSVTDMPICHTTKLQNTFFYAYSNAVV